MSVVAEFAASLHETQRGRTARAHTPVSIFSTAQTLYDMRAVIFDVYGTLIDYRKDEFEDAAAREAALLKAFSDVVGRFGLEDALSAMAPETEPSKILCDMYNGLIALEHRSAHARGIETPEVRIERIWGVILMLLKKRGFNPSLPGLGSDEDTAKCMAYYYHFKALGRGFFPGVVDALARLKDNGLRLGIVSNAQFYTPIDLTLFVREQSGGAYDDYTELFDDDLTFFSYEYGTAKPGMAMYEALEGALRREHISLSQAVFAGNDLVADIEPAAGLGMRTALYCGDERSMYTHGREREIIADIAFEHFDELPARIRFHGEGSN